MGDDGADAVTARRCDFDRGLDVAFADGFDFAEKGVARTGFAAIFPIDEERLCPVHVLLREIHIGGSQVGRRMAEDLLHDRQRHVALHQLHGPRPADDLGGAQLARQADGFGLFVKFAAHMGRVQLERTPLLIPRPQQRQDALNLGRHRLRNLDVAVGGAASFVEPHRALLGIEIFRRLQSQHFVEPGARISDQQKNQENPPAGMGEIRTIAEIHPHA